MDNWHLNSHYVTKCCCKPSHVFIFVIKLSVKWITHSMWIWVCLPLYTTVTGSLIKVIGSIIILPVRHHYKEVKGHSRRSPTRKEHILWPSTPAVAVSTACCGTIKSIIILSSTFVNFIGCQIIWFYNRWVRRGTLDDVLSWIYYK